jgi:hypothetical protein
VEAVAVYWEFESSDAALAAACRADARVLLADMSDWFKNMWLAAVPVYKTISSSMVTVD